MAVLLSVNAGFVTATPTADPAGQNSLIGGRSRALKLTARVGYAAITQVGWWTGGAPAPTNYEVGLYQDNATNSVPGAAIYRKQTNAIITAVGWQNVAVSWSVTSGTIYWLACQCDYPGTAVLIDSTITAAQTCVDALSQVTLLDPFTSDAVNSTGVLYALYATVVTAAGGITHNLTGSISGVSYLTAAGWSVNRYVSGSISGVGNLVNAGVPITHYVTGAISGVSYLTADLTKQATNINIVSNITAAPYHTRDGSDGLLVKGGLEAQGGFYTDGGVGQTITFTAQDGRTVTVNKGIIIAIS